MVLMHAHNSAPIRETLVRVLTLGTRTTVFIGREPVMQVVTHVGGKADYDHHVRYI